MSGVNKVILIGHVGRDPETRYTAAGKCVASFSVATSEKWTDKATGRKKEQTEWHNVTAFERLAEIAGEYLHKGSLAYIEGSLRTEKWTDKEGVERYSTKVRASSIQMLGGKDDGEKPAKADRSKQPARKQEEPPRDDFEDDIPF